MSKFKSIEQMNMEAYVKKHGREPNIRLFPLEMKPKTPKSAAQLESLIVRYLEGNGCICTKVSTTGRPIIDKYKGRIVDVTYIPGTTEPGTSDLIASIPGVIGAVYIEVKFSKSDRQSPVQASWQAKVERAGFRYHIVKSLKELMQLTSEL